MANRKKISELPIAAALDGSEVVPVVQAGLTSRTLLSAITNYISTTATAFIQAGIGAFARSNQSKLRDKVSLLDFIPPNLHTSIKDGTNITDLATYIQAALDAAVSVEAPAGIYLASTIRLNPRNSLIGTGHGGTD